MTTNANLFAHFQKSFPVDLNSELLLTADGRSVTYAEADHASARIANSLMQLGAAVEEVAQRTAADGDPGAAERACEESLALPVYPGLEPNAQEYVVDSIAQFFRKGV